MSTPVITELDRASGAATLRLNRPERRNALNAALVAGLREALENLRHDDDVRCVLIRGEGAAFCAGADLEEIRAMQNADIHQNQANSHNLREFFSALYNFPKPTIALVHGPALAGGCGLATCCDFVLATREATFGYPEVKIGFIPAIVMVLLTHQIGERAARDLCLSGRALSADEALRLGLISQVLEAHELEAAAAKLGRDLRRNAPQAMATIKRMFWRLHEKGTEDGLVWAADMNAIARGTDECKEGIAAFLEKRKPNWASTDT